MADDRRANRSLSEWTKIAPPPVVPVWVPGEMKELLAHTLYRLTSNLNEVALLNRMATDPRMKTVWVGLMKKSRLKGEAKFFHSKPPPAGIKGGESWRFAVLEMLFRNIFAHGKLCISERSGKLPKGIGQKRDALDQAATKLAGDAWFVRRMAARSKGRIRAHCVKLAKQLEKAALAYREVSYLLQNNYFANNELVAILFSTMTATSMRDCLGSQKYGLVAIIASIILEREIKQSDVRQWCGGPWGIPKQRANSP